MRAINGLQNSVCEWNYTSSKNYENCFMEVDLDVALTSEDNKTWRVPAYWGGGNDWRVRFCPLNPGTYTISTECSDPENQGLHGEEAVLEVAAYENANPLFSRGPLKISSDKRTFEFADGTPFQWLGDTWWMGLCNRLKWPEDFQRLVADRVEKGYSIIQIVAGLYPDMSPLDDRCKNEAGLPWTEGFENINPAYFDMADLRIQWLVKSGLIPCIVGCWGYYFMFMGTEKLKKHWRYLVARWSAYPVVWCLAGEASMKYYGSTKKEEDRVKLVAAWTEIGRYVRDLEPMGRLLTIHPNQIGRDQVSDDSILDFDMLQTGHSGKGSAANAVAKVQDERDRKPTMPVVAGEGNYEGILNSSGPELQRLSYWTAMLAGAAGLTYGANGLWQVNLKDKPFGRSPHGADWGQKPWDEAFQLEGCKHLSIAAELLRRYDWWRMEPHPEWMDPHGSRDNVGLPFIAGIPGEVRIMYMYSPNLSWQKRDFVFKGFEKDITYKAFFFDPRTGQKTHLGEIDVDAEGSWILPMPPTMQDWVVVLERV